MFDLHVHSTLSDGELIPSEIARRMAAMGNEGVAITDHADFSNIPLIMDCLRKLQDLRDDYGVELLFGVEITHVPPKLIGKAVELAWREGAEIVVVHGETIAEPVEKGTNEVAVQEEIDILAHPGLIDIKTAELAASNGVYLEISARRGHCLANGHVARIALETGCKLVINTDAHSPDDFIDDGFAMKVLVGAGLDAERSAEVLENNKRVFRKRSKGGN